MLAHKLMISVFRMGLYEGTPKTEIWSLALERSHCPGSVPYWDSRLLSTMDFSTLFKSECWSAQLGGVMLLLFCFYLSFLLMIVY